MRLSAKRSWTPVCGSGDPAFASHKHDLIIKPYMPKVNDLVLVLYFPVFNGDGVILGGVKPWR